MTRKYTPWITIATGLTQTEAVQIAAQFKTHSICGANGRAMNGIGEIGPYQVRIPERGSK